VVVAMHRLLKLTPSAMLGVSLADMVGETRTENVPGTDREYPHWSVPLGDSDGRPVYVDQLAESPVFKAITAVMADG
jgi:4-alpha-glucanotransferase